MSLRTLLVAARDRMDGALHARRGRRARAKLAALAPSSVLFVCLGNICRSPFAERVLALRTRGALAVASSGFIGPGRAPPDEALRAARARGIEHADHVSSTLTPETIDRAQAIFVFDRFNLARLRRAHGGPLERVLWLGDFDPEWSGKRAIVDPFGKSADDFASAFARIERCVDEVARTLTVGADVG